MLAAPQPEGDVEDDPAPRLALERARAVAEAARLRRELVPPRRCGGRARARRPRCRRSPARRPRRSGSASRPRSRGCRRGTRRPRGPPRRSGRRARPTARPPRRGRARGRRPRAARARGCGRAARSRATPSSATTTFDPPASSTSGSPRVVGVAHGGDEVLLRRRLAERPRRSSEAQRRVRRELHAAHGTRAARPSVQSTCDPQVLILTCVFARTCPWSTPPHSPRRRSPCTSSPCPRISTMLRSRPGPRWRRSSRTATRSRSSRPSRPPSSIRATSPSPARPTSASPRASTSWRCAASRTWRPRRASACTGSCTCRSPRRSTGATTPRTRCYGALREDDDIAPDLRAALDVLGSFDLILAPLALGDHVDHRQLLRALGLPGRWDDPPPIPALRPRARGALARHAARHRRVRPADARATTRSSCPGDALQRKLAACACYTSQIDARFGGERRDARAALRPRVLRGQPPRPPGAGGVLRARRRRSSSSSGSRLLPAHARRLTAARRRRGA